MTTGAVAAPSLRSLRDALLPALAGLIAPYAVAAGWGLLARAIWGPGWRLAVWVDPTAALPAGYAATSLLFTGLVGALIGAGLALARARRVAVAPWALWVAFALGVALSVIHAEPRALAHPVILLLIASSALGFRLGARR
jgi:hypothetical protein